MRFLRYCRSFPRIFPELSHSIFFSVFPGPETRDILKSSTQKYHKITSKNVLKRAPKSIKNETLGTPWTLPGSESETCPLIPLPRVAFWSQRHPQGRPKILSFAKRSLKWSNKNASGIETWKNIEKVRFLDGPNPSRSCWGCSESAVLTFAPEP